MSGGPLPILSYQPAADGRRPLACRVAMGCAIVAACMYAALVAFARLVVEPAYWRVVVSSVHPSPSQRWYDICKAIAITLFLAMLVVLATGAISAIVTMVRHPRWRRRAVLALGLCGVILGALAVTR